MERINHVYIIEICRCRLISEIYHMVERQVPDGKCFKFCIARLHTTQVFMIDLAETGRHFSASGTRGCHHNQRPLGFYIVVFSKPLRADNQRKIRRIPFDRIMPVDFHSQGLQLLFIGNRRLLSGKLRQNDTPHHESVI